MTWTPERTAALVQLADEGLTHTTIARKLGTTRQAVQSKLKRLKGEPEPEERTRNKGSWDTRLFESWEDRKARRQRERVSV